MQQDRSGEASRLALPTVKAAENGEGIVTFAPIVSKATPAVVNISAARIVRAGERGRGQMPPQLPPEFRDFFGFGDRSPFGGGPPQDRRQEGAGSGVIVTNDGYLLTNNHVVEDATEVNVVLSDRREFRAKIVGMDPQTDIAVLKVDATGLPHLPMSDSSRVRVGDLALAIGNPFGIGQTVTMGIVSATGRSVGISAEGGYEDFIQTDAAINPGNSGGALLNTRGELIGINTAIIARGGGGNQGVGFAVPVNLARNVMEQIVKTGKVTRGWLGVGIQPMTPSLARAFGLKEPAGVAVTEVQPNTPAEKAGINSGDVIISMNGEPIKDLNSFRLKVATMKPGSEVKLALWRDGKERSVTVTLGELPGQRAASGDGPGEGTESRSLTGVSVEPLTPQALRQLELPQNTTGVVVTDVSQASPAFAAGLRRGDVIEQVNRKNIATVEEFERAVAQAGKEPILLQVRSQGGSRFVAVEQR
jgi:Do/DeqQ family serine protease